MSEIFERALAAYLTNSMGSPPDQAALRAALSAALDPHSSELQDVILGAMGFYAIGPPNNYSPRARVQAHDAIAALKAHALGGSDPK